MSERNRFLKYKMSLGFWSKHCKGCPEVSFPSRLSAFLDNVDVGDYIVQGDIEAYSCEHISPLLEDVMFCLTLARPLHALAAPDAFNQRSNEQQTRIGEHAV